MSSKIVSFLKRTKKEYESTLGPKLLLIAEKPLLKDSVEIFDSIKGINYLSTCFRSKFKSAETHLTYINDETNTPFARNTFFNIIAHYYTKGTLDINNLVVGFIGQNSYDAFIKSYNDSTDTDRIELYVKEKQSVLKVFCAGAINTDKYIKYKILPSVNDNLDNLIDELNSMNSNTSAIDSPYCSTDQIISKLKIILELYETGCIKYFRFDAKANYITKKIEYFKIYDKYNNKELLYCPRDEICKDDSKEKKLEFVTLIEKVLKTVPVYGNDIEKTISLFKYHADIKTLAFEDINEEAESRASFELTSTNGNLNGVKSDWYDKWYKNVFSMKLKQNMTKNQILLEGYKDKIKYEWIFDIEVFGCDWLFVAKTLDRTAKLICWNDSEQLAQWMQDKILIGFNNAAYDNPVVKHIISMPWYSEKVPTVKEFSDSLIHKSESSQTYYELKNDVPSYIKRKTLSWDISFHMPFDTRRASLKKLTMAVLDRKNYDSAVSFDTDRPLTKIERKEVERYCEMDVDNTLDLFLPDENNKKRTFARDSYDIRWNLINEYNMSAKTLINKASSFAGKVLCGEEAKPTSSNTYKIVDGKKQYYAIPKMAYDELANTDILEFYLKNQSNPDYIHESFEVYINPDGTKDETEDPNNLYQFGFGGLHQALIKYRSTNLVNMDVASLYPSLLVQYDLMSRGAKNPKSYEDVYHTRLKAKHDGHYLLNQGLKLILNGAIGAMLSAYNPLYDTWANSTICVHGQLLLFILVKRLIKAGFKIVQVNTDGIMIEKRDDVDYVPIADEWQKQTRLVLEFDQIDLLQQNNVNNYYCKFTNGDVKSKGFYLSNEKFGKATSKILCNIVTEKPPLEGLTPKDFVIYKKHSIGEIYDGITHKKVDGRSLAFVCGFESDSRTQSYYSRSRNSRITKVKDDKGHDILDENGNPLEQTVHTESKIVGFSDHMLLVDDVNALTMEEIDTSNYIAFARNLLDRQEEFGPYFTKDFQQTEDPDVFQALNAFKDNTINYAMKSNVYCQNFLFECDFTTKEEQEEMIEKHRDMFYRITWSGHKSYHCIVRIDKPIKGTLYQRMWYTIRNMLEFQGCDAQCSIQSKYTRVPGQINPKTGEEQKLYAYDRNILDSKLILEKIDKFPEESKPFKEFTGKRTIDALKRHIKRLDWSEGNRFAAVQKLSPTLISQVDIEDLLDMIPIDLEKDHKRVIRAKYYYYEKYLENDNNNSFM